MSEFTILQSRLLLIEGDITDSIAEVIVSSDDAMLRMSGGVSSMIYLKGGDNIKNDIEKHRNSKSNDLTVGKRGDVIVTSAGKLKAKYIFHGVSIDIDTFYNFEQYLEELQKGNPTSILEVVFNIIEKCFQLAPNLGIRSLAFPIIGTGAASFPYELTVEIMVILVIHFIKKSPEPMEIYLYLYNFESQLKTSKHDFYGSITSLVSNPGIKSLSDSLDLLRNLSTDIRSTIQKFILKSKFSLLEGNVEHSLNELNMALDLAIEKNMKPEIQIITKEKNRLEREFIGWREIIDKNTNIYSIIDKIEFGQYLSDVKEILREP